MIPSRRMMLVAGSSYLTYDTIEETSHHFDGRILPFAYINSHWLHWPNNMRLEKVMAATLGLADILYDSPFFLADSPPGVPDCSDLFPAEVSVESMLGICNGVATDEALFEDSWLAGDPKTLVSSDCGLNAPTTTPAMYVVAFV